MTRTAISKQQNIVDQWKFVQIVKWMIQIYATFFYAFNIIEQITSKW